MLDALRDCFLSGSNRNRRDRRALTAAGRSRPLEFYSPSIDVLEERRLLSVTLPTATEAATYASPAVADDTSAVERSTVYSGQTAYTDFAAASGAEPIGTHVVSCDIFYNNSPLDGNDPIADAADDGAIALDKTALLPGGTASAANYTTYSRGINGIMIDIAGLRGVPTANDFIFEVGNTANPSQWFAAPQPISVTARAGDGVGGSTRVTITWPDNSIQNEWLQVTVKATVNTGLSADDVFYFGNVIGGSSTSLLLLAAPALPPPVAAPLQPELFNNGDGGFFEFTSPNLVMTNNGTVFAMAEGRSYTPDQSAYAIVMRRSTDNGATWSPISVIYGILPHTADWVGNPSAVMDATTGNIFVLFTKDNSSVFVVHSSDDGLTWSSPTNITNNVKVTSAGNPNPSAFPSAPWGWYATGPGHGIQLQDGPNAGRLMIAADHRLAAGTNGPSWSHVIYSDDDGESWHLGGGLDQTQAVNDYSNEPSLVEQSDGSLYMSIRVNNGSLYHGYSRSFDGGVTWTNLATDTALTTFNVEGSILRIDANTVLFSAPDSSNGVRHQMTIWVSYDNMQSWVKAKVIDYGFAAYSDMVLIGPDTVLLEFDAGQSVTNSFQYMALAAFNLKWLQSSTPYEFSWYFNEQPPGQPANIQGVSLQDSSPWNNRAQAQAASPSQAPMYVAGVHSNDSALEVTANSDVQLTPASINALQFSATDSFTVELVMRTTASNGVIIGTLPSIQNWTLQVSGGLLEFSLYDGRQLAVIQSPAHINDGQWHRIAVVRDAENHQLLMYVDGVQATAPVADTTLASLQSSDPVMLGAYNGGTGQLAFDVDTLRVTRSVLAPSQFLAAGFVAPERSPATTYPSNAPNTIPGSQLWFPADDPTHDFSDFYYADPLPLSPVSGTAVHSVIDASPNQFQASLGSVFEQMSYAYDAAVGSNWAYPANSPNAGEQLIVHDSNGTDPNNFDFVQDSGVFTLSTFIHVSWGVGSNYMVLFDTADTAIANSGFSLTVTPDGALNLTVADVVGSNSAVRFSGHSPTGLITSASWYQVAAVGTGTGNPITFYVTPVTSSTVTPYLSTADFTGANGNYPTDTNHDLAIGASDVMGRGAFNGNMVDQVIYNRALSAAEIQQLFNYTTLNLGGRGVGPVFSSAVNVDFGSVPFGATPTQTLQVGNTTSDGDLGNLTNLTLLSASITGPGAGHFALSGFTPGMVLACGYTVPFNIQFDGTTGNLAAYNAMLTLVTDQGAALGSPGQTFTIPLSAVLATRIDLNGPARPGIGLTSTWGSLNNVPVNITDPAATVSDTPSPNLTLMTATISSLQAGDILSANTTGTRITQSFVGGTLTLSGSDTVANYQQVLESITFNTTTLTYRSETINVVATDDGGRQSATATATVNVDPGAPVTDLNGPDNAGNNFTSAIVATTAPVHITDFTATVTDADSATLSRMTATIANPSAADTLSATASGGVHVTGIGTSLLTFSGSASAAAYTTALKTMTFSTAVLTTRTVTVNVVASDDGLLTGTKAVATVHIAGATPVVSLDSGAGAPSFTTTWFNSGPVPIENMVQASVTDSDASTPLTSLTVTLATFHTGDVLAVPILPGVSPSLTTTYSAGTLVLSGSDTPANYLKELRFVNYNNTAGGPGTSPITVTFVASDGTVSSSPVTATVNIKVASGQVLGNRLFYNNSKYDNSNTAIGASDDLAIASDKVGFSGVGLSNFSAVSGFNKGITGIMVDLASGIGTHSNINLTSGDITFKISPVTFVTTTFNQLSTWTAAPTPANISVRLGAGVGGSDRLEITWANLKITNTWLEVNVKSDASTGHTNTGLSADDVFYFASVIGNAGVGDTTALSKDDGNDFTATNNNVIGVTTPVWNVMDYTKDFKVDANDGTVNTNNVFTLRYIANPTGPFAPNAAPSAAPAPAAVAVARAASVRSTAAVASGLSLTSSLPTALPTWLSGRLQNVLDSQGIAKILLNLTHPGSVQIHEAIDQVAEKRHLNDDLLDELLADLALEESNA